MIGSGQPSERRVASSSRRLSAPPSTTGEYAPTRDEPLVFSIGWLNTGKPGDMQLPSIEAFTDYVTEHTGGMITFEYFPGGQLGNEQDMLDQILDGSLDFSPISSTVLASIWPEMYCYALPFAVSNYDTAWQIWGADGHNEGALHKKLADVVEESGLCHYLSSFSFSFRGLQNTKHPIRCADDFKDITIRVQGGEIYTEMYNLLGASTASVNFSELFTSLQQGIVDCDDLGIAFWYSSGYYDVDKYSTEFNHSICPNSLVMSNAAFDKLNEKEIEILYESMLVAEHASNTVTTESLDEYYPLAVEKGIEVVRYADLTAEELQSLRDAVQPLWEKYRPVIGEEVYTLLQDARGAVLGEEAVSG